MNLFPQPKKKKKEREKTLSCTSTHDAWPYRCPNLTSDEVTKLSSHRSEEAVFFSLSPLSESADRRRFSGHFSLSKDFYASLLSRKPRYSKTFIAPHLHVLEMKRGTPTIAVHLHKTPCIFPISGEKAVWGKQYCPGQKSLQGTSIRLSRGDLWEKGKQAARVPVGEQYSDVRDHEFQFTQLAIFSGDIRRKRDHIQEDSSLVVEQRVLYMPRAWMLAIDSTQ